MDFYQKIIEDIRKEYEARDEVRALIVTGSVARGEAHLGNDLDILLLSTGIHISKEYRVESSLVELGTITLPTALENMSKNPMSVYMYLDAKAIFDKDNSLELLHKRAQEVLVSYKPTEENKKLLKKWLSSVVDKVIVAEKNEDTEKVAFHVSNVLWKTVEGLYTINFVPTPASTSALRRIRTLKVLPENFDTLWKDVLMGNLQERTKATIFLIKFVLSKIE